MRRGPLISALVDAAVAMAAVFLAYQVRFTLRIPPYIPGGEGTASPNHYAIGAVVAAAILVTTFFLLGIYRRRRGVQFIDEWIQVMGGILMASIAVLAGIGLYREGQFGFTYSRLTFFYWVGALAVLLSFSRYGVRRYIAAERLRKGADRALVVGWGAGADLLVQRIRMFPDYGYRLVGILADELPAGEEVAGVKVLGRPRELERVVRNRNVGVVFLALSNATQDELLQLMDDCKECEVEFRIVPRLLELLTTQMASDELAGVPLLQVRHGLDIDPSKVIFKRLIDLLVGGLGLIAVSPFLALIALAVRVSSPGPVILHQERVGMNGRPFRMHKFRSMREDAEVDTGPVWAAEDDPRRTAVGKLLRRLSLDELPQLWNIVVGEMSLVGPRAERPSFVQEFEKTLPRYGDRLKVRPGLAGWAQANDLRGQTPVEERLIYDLYYIENWSLAFDLKILLITVARVWTHKNAY